MRDVSAFLPPSRRGPSSSPRRRAALRAEVDWPETPTPVMGAAEATTQAGSFEGVAAVLWVPDPEQRHGWRELYVKAVPDKPGGKPFGFHKRA